MTNPVLKLLLSILVTATIIIQHSTNAWLLMPSINNNILQQHNTNKYRKLNNGVYYYLDSLFMNSNTDDGTNNNVAATAATAAATTMSSQFSDEELSSIVKLYEKCQQVQDDENMLERTIMEYLPTMNPSLLFKLRQVSSPDDNSADNNNEEKSNNNNNEKVQLVSKYINEILQKRMDIGKDTLTNLLNAGEINKLDKLISRAAKDGKLDVAFFNILTMNLEDAMQNNNYINNKDEEVTTKGASRLQILQHIYTRCQEEVEKLIPPGTALLNKLLRTEQAEIRFNLYKYYLTPQPITKTIITPDGKTLELNNNDANKVLVPLNEFVTAIDNTVLQIRNVENIGGTDRESAAIMVESCRSIAKEARIIIGDTYGRDSIELQNFEKELQPVFRPSSPNSPYICGE